MKFVVAFVIFAFAISANASVIPLGWGAPIAVAPAAGSVAIHAPAIHAPLIAHGGIITHSGLVAHPGLVPLHVPAAVTVAKTIW